MDGDSVCVAGAAMAGHMQLRIENVRQEWEDANEPT